MAIIAKNKILLIPIIIVALILGFFLRPKNPKPVETETVTKTNLVQSISITGSVTADRFAELSFLVGGKLTYLGASQGDFVKKFQTIAALDQRTAQKNLENALIDYSKERNSFEQTKENYNNETPTTAINGSVKRILEDNQFDLDKSVKSVELVTLAREQSVLTTPIDGILTRADVNSTGVNVGVTDVWTVVDPDSLVFKMEVDEADIAKVRDGQQVELILDSYPDETINIAVDKIDFVTHTTSTGGNAYNVRANMPINSDYRYRIGMNGNAQIITRKKKNVLTISLSSIENDDEVLVKKDSKFEKRKIKTGIENDTSVEVIDGLSEGDIVAADPTNIPKDKIVSSN